MLRYRKILAAVDASGPGKNAFRQACRVARRFNSWVTAVTVVPSCRDQFETRGAYENLRKMLMEEGERAVLDVVRIAREEDVYIRSELLEGNPPDALLETAEEGGYDLIVMGKSGPARLDRALSGSVTARVIAHARRDVFVVPNDTTVGWERILLPTDGSRCSEAAAVRAIELAKALSTDITAVSVPDVNDEYSSEVPGVSDKVAEELKASLDEVRKKACSSGVRAMTLVMEGEAHEAITGLAKSIGASIIVMGSHGRTGIRKFLMGSVTERVIAGAPCPVLVVKP